MLDTWVTHVQLPVLEQEPAGVLKPHVVVKDVSLLLVLGHLLTLTSRSS